MPRRSKSRSRSLFRSRQEEKRLIVSKVIKTTKDIKKVARIAKVSERTVYRCKRSLKARRTIKRKVGSGRVSTLNKRQKNRLQDLLKENPFLSCNDLKTRLQIPASIETIRRYFINDGFTRRKPTHKLDLLPKHVERRFLWAQMFRNFIHSPETIFTDECSVWLNDNNREGWFNNEKDHPLSTDKHCGKIHCWAAVNMMYGKISFTTFKGNMDAQMYVQILKDHFVPYAEEFFPDGYFLMQDNDPKHKSHVARDFIQQNVSRFIEWPTKSPDLNPLENIWSIFKQNVRKRLSKCLDELEDCLYEEWEKLDNNMIKKTCDSFPQRVQECYDLRGAQTHY